MLSLRQGWDSKAGPERGLQTAEHWAGPRGLGERSQVGIPAICHHREGPGNMSRGKPARANMATARRGCKKNEAHRAAPSSDELLSGRVEHTYTCQHPAAQSGRTAGRGRGGQAVTKPIHAASAQHHTARASLAPHETEEPPLLPSLKVQAAPTPSNQVLLPFCFSLWGNMSSPYSTIHPSVLVSCLHPAMPPHTHLMLENPEQVHNGNPENVEVGTFLLRNSKVLAG